MCHVKATFTFAISIQAASVRLLKAICLIVNISFLDTTDHSDVQISSGILDSAVHHKSTK